MKALGYFRVGMETGRPGDAASLLEQEQAFLRFCQEQGYEPLSIFVDLQPTESGEYPEYRRLLDYLRRQPKGFLIVVTRNLNQLGGDPRDWLNSLLELEQLGARVVCMEDGILDPMTAALKAWAEKRQQEGRGGKVREAMRLKAIRGEGLGKPAFGYRIGADRRFEIMSQEAAVVQLIYRLYTENKMGLRRIARYLNEQGITTRRGGLWSMVSLYDILRNRTYLGTYTRFGMRVPGSHPPIVSADTFRQIQERLSAGPKATGYTKATPFLLSGLSYCGYCGNRMIGVSRHQSWTRRRNGEPTQAHYHYYQCQSRTNQSICSYHTRRAEDLETAVIAELREHKGQESSGSARATAAEITSERPRLEARIKALERRLRQHLDHAAAGQITLQQLRGLHHEIATQRHDLEQRLALLEAKARQEAGFRQEQRRSGQALRQLRERWETLPTETKRELLKTVVERITVYDDHIEVTLKY